MKIDLEELKNAGLIDSQTHDAILRHYNNQKSSISTRLYQLFALLGSLLAGLGLILIIAHNWDDLTKEGRTILAFFPLCLSLALCWYAIIKKPNKRPWREGVSILLILSIGAGISLLNQIYHIPGDLASFMLNWALLSIPLTYVMNSSSASLLSLTLSGIYCVSTGFEGAELNYGLMSLALLPAYLLHSAKRSKSNYTLFHHWLWAITSLLMLGTFVSSLIDLSLVVYMASFGLFLLIAKVIDKPESPIWSKAWLLLGGLGIMGFFYVFSFHQVWASLAEVGSDQNPDILTSIIAWTFASVVLLVCVWKSISQRNNPQSLWLLSLPVFVLAYLLRDSEYISAILINAFVLVLGIRLLEKAVQNNQLGEMNFALLIILVLAACRFFDDQIPFYLRGLLFLIVGIGFVTANILLIRKRSKNED